MFMISLCMLYTIATNHHIVHLHSTLYILYIVHIHLVVCEWGAIQPIVVSLQHVLLFAPLFGPVYVASLLSCCTHHMYSITSSMFSHPSNFWCVHDYLHLYITNLLSCCTHHVCLHYVIHHALHVTSSVYTTVQTHVRYKNHASHSW